MPKSTTETLTALLVQYRPDRPQGGYPDWLRCRVGAFVRERGETYLNLTSLAATLGVSRTALRSWSQLAAVPEARGFAPVVIKESIATALCAHPPIDDDHGIDLLTPDGFQLRGLSWEQSIRAVQTLR